MISINLDVRSEWKIHIPMSDVCEKIGFCLRFDTLDSTDPAADGLRMNEQLTAVDLL